MNCITIERIHLYLDKALSPAEDREIQEHLARCPQCRKAVEERQLLLEAAGDLPLWETPSDFTEQVMARIFPASTPLAVWIGALSAGFASTVLALLIFFIVSGQNLLTLFVFTNDALWTSLSDISSIFIKLFKLAAVLLMVLEKLLEFLIKSLSSLTTVLSPQVQLVLITIALILVVSSVYGLRKKFLFGDKA